eukprot:13072997-Alexandrium_andersonii.AAC.1
MSKIPKSRLRTPCSETCLRHRRGRQPGSGRRARAGSQWPRRGGCESTLNSARGPRSPGALAAS